MRSFQFAVTNGRCASGMDFVQPTKRLLFYSGEVVIGLFHNAIAFETVSLFHQ